MKIKFDKLDLGCGNKKPLGYIGVDVSYFDYPKGEFVQADINYPLPFKDGSFMVIQAISTIEHIDNSRKVGFINEMYRLLKHGGVFIAVFPPPICSNGNSNPVFFTDPTHTAWWTPGTFICFDKDWRDNDINKEVYKIGYNINTNFKIVTKDSRWIDNHSFHLELIKF